MKYLVLISLLFLEISVAGEGGVSGGGTWPEKMLTTLGPNLTRGKTRAGEYFRAQALEKAAIKMPSPMKELKRTK